MKYLFIILILIVLISCNNDKVSVKFNNSDTAEMITDVMPEFDSTTITPATNYLDYKVEDYTLPDEYQHKAQLCADSTLIMSWDEAGFKNAIKFIGFIEQFQLLVKDRDKQKIAACIKFPLRQIQTQKEFLDNFDAIFNDAFSFEVIDQNTKEIFRDKRGAMIGKDGQLWFKPMNGTYKIVSINF